MKEEVKDEKTEAQEGADANDEGAGSGAGSSRDPPAGELVSGRARASGVLQGNLCLSCGPSSEKAWPRRQAMSSEWATKASWRMSGPEKQAGRESVRHQADLDAGRNPKLPKRWRSL